MADESVVDATLRLLTVPGGDPGVAVDALRVDTVRELEPATVPLVAVIVVVPLPTLVANPLELIVATPVLLELHMTAAPGITLPPASFTTATNCSVPGPTMDAGAAGVTVTEAAGPGVET